MEITWLGHSCFRLKGKEATLVTDPCDKSFGCSLANINAGIVTLSHRHPGHSYAQVVSGNPKILSGPGEYEISGIFITGIPTFHDPHQGKDRGKNTAYLIEIDDLTLCHLGDLGHKLSPQQVEHLGSAEILFVPVGGLSTIDAKVAVETVRLLSPRVVIPMHYNTEAVTWLAPVEDFLKAMGVKQATPQHKASITKANLPTETTVVVLDYH